MILEKTHCCGCRLRLSDTTLEIFFGSEKRPSYHSALTGAAEGLAEWSFLNNSYRFWFNVIKSLKFIWGFFTHNLSHSRFLLKSNLGVMIAFKRVFQESTGFPRFLRAWTVVDTLFCKVSSPTLASKELACLFWISLLLS